MVYQDLRRLNCPLLGNHIGYLVHCYLQLHCKLHLLLRSLIPIYFYRYRTHPRSGQLCLMDTTNCLEHLSAISRLGHTRASSLDQQEPQKMHELHE